MAILRRKSVLFPMVLGLLLGMGMMYLTLPGPSEADTPRPTLASLQQGMDTLNSQMTALTGRVTTVETTVTDLGVDVAALEADAPRELCVSASSYTIAQANAMGGLSATLPAGWRVATMWEALTLLSSHDTGVPAGEYFWVVGSYENTQWSGKEFVDSYGKISNLTQVTTGYNFAVYSGESGTYVPPFVNALPNTDSRRVLGVRK